MPSVLPSLLDPWWAVANRWVFVGCLPLADLSRLRSLLLDARGDVWFRLGFSRDEARRAVLRCEVAATLRLRCQRCLEALEHKVGADTWLALVLSADEERRLPECYDPLPVDERPIRPLDLIEDELLLALPQIPMHEPVVCGRRGSEGDRVRMRSSGTSPFAVLAGLKEG